MKEQYEGRLLSQLLNPESGEIMLISYNFPKTAWNKNSPLGKKLIEWNSKNIKIRVVGGPEIESFEYVQELAKEGIIDIRLLRRSRKEHICIATEPKQIYLEKNHTKGLAKNCYYTDNPFPGVYQRAIEEFNNLWEHAHPLDFN